MHIGGNNAGNGQYLLAQPKHVTDGQKQVRRQRTQGRHELRCVRVRRIEDRQAAPNGVPREIGPAIVPRGIGGRPFRGGHVHHGDNLAVRLPQGLVEPAAKDVLRTAEKHDSH